MDSKCSVHLIVYTCISIAQYALFIDWFSLAVWLYLSSASKGRTVNWFTSGRSLTWLVVRYVPIESFSVYIWCTQSGVFFVTLLDFWVASMNFGWKLQGRKVQRRNWFKLKLCTIYVYISNFKHKNVYKWTLQSLTSWKLKGGTCFNWLLDHFQVNIVDPLKLTQEFSTILADQIIATNVVATCHLHKRL